tara:strand:- start:323 stop:772 length:450 start_codon:yes stop_codon:yes gene_type:complete
MKISSIRELKKIANKIKDAVLPGDSILLHGEIGVGKTTFARLFINSCENKNKLKKSEVLSPTFNIVFEYEFKDYKIKHFDLYRLKNDIDINNIGLFEDIDESILLIEWPELIKKKPTNRIELLFKYTRKDNERLLKINSFGRLKNYEFG